MDHSDDSELEELRNPTISLRDKLNRHIERKNKSGVLPHAVHLNKYVPWYFMFHYLGAVVWLSLGTAPHYYWENPGWLLITEIYIVYISVQILVNWLLTCYTTSPYIPDTQHRILENEVQSLQTFENKDIHYDVTKLRSNEAMIDKKTNGRTGLTYRVMVVTKITGNKPQRESIPYWSWVQCFSCRRPRPPRCHHCTLCNHCVLKRDHHCYFTRNCVGVQNHRYFMYYLIWCIQLCVMSCYHFIPFIRQEIFTKHSYTNLIFPINVFRTAYGELPVPYCHLMIMIYGVLFLTIVSIGMFMSSSYLIVKSLTKFESSAEIKVHDIRSLPEKIQAVMGRNWAVGLFIPGGASSSFIKSWLPFSCCPSEPLEDAVAWPYIKP